MLYIRKNQMLVAAFAVAAMSFAACYDEQDFNAKPAAQVATFSASAETRADITSKTAIVKKGTTATPYFCGDEDLAIFCSASLAGSSAEKFSNTAANNELSSTATFSASIADNSSFLSSAEYFGVLPYSAAKALTAVSDESATFTMTLPSAQTATLNGIDPKAHLLAASTTADSKSFNFKSVCAYLKLNVTLPSESITITDTKGNQMAGTFSLTVDNSDNLSYTCDATDASTITLGAMEEGFYYVPFLPGDHKIDIKATYSDGTTYTMNLKAGTFQRNHVYSIEFQRGVTLPKSVFSANVPNTATKVTFAKTLEGSLSDYDVLSKTGTSNGETVAIPNHIHIYQSKTTTTEYLVTSDEGYYILSDADCSLMFYGYTKLTTVDFTNFNTKNATNMIGMFQNCYVLTNPDLSGFNTAKVTDMQSMFYNCRTITNLDLSSFNTKKVTNMSNMFCECRKMVSLNISSFDTENVENMSSIFYDCSKLTSLDLTNFNTAQVTNTSSMFNLCNGLISLDLSSFNTSLVTNMTDMFANCQNITTIYVSDKFTVGDACSSTNMFQACGNLVGKDGTTYKFVFNENYVDKTYAKICKAPSAEGAGDQQDGYFTAAASK